MKEWDLQAADDYVKYNTLDSEDFLELAVDDDDLKAFKIARLNIAYRVLRMNFKPMKIPDEAVYYFASILSAQFNDTMVMSQRGVASFSIRGIAFTFKDWAKKELSDFITDEVEDIINEANDDDDDNRRTRGIRVRTVLM